MLDPDLFYQHNETSTIKCGSCWEVDIERTRSGDYTNDERVFKGDLQLLRNDDPLQCDDCLVQNEAYDELETESGFTTENTDEI